MSLIAYRLKRNFKNTKEPRPKINKIKKNRQRFVIQKHQASRLHYDFRMEFINEKNKEIVLKSWAIPKNIPLIEGEKHLAIETEDHPINYIDFEGEIPLGNYGAGKVEIWDKGKWGMIKGSFNENKVSFNLFGEKIKGRFIMIKINKFNQKGKENNQNWLIWKKSKVIGL